MVINENLGSECIALWRVLLWFVDIEKYILFNLSRWKQDLRKSLMDMWCVRHFRRLYKAMAKSNNYRRRICPLSAWHSDTPTEWIFVTVYISDF
jgi:hypothetical protein